jgi:hypothetical protein
MTTKDWAMMFGAWVVGAISGILFMLWVFGVI